MLSFSQVGIGTTTPNSSSILDVTATDKGMLIPRVSLIAVNNLTSPINTPATGLMIWNTNATVTGGAGTGFYFYNGTVWQPVNTNTSNTLDGAYDQGGAGAGRVIIADANPVRINGTDGFWVTGTHGSGAVLEASTTNSKMFFYPRKSAFRAGYDDTNAWVDANIGNYSAAFGRNTLATGDYSFAAGDVNTASGMYSSVFGTNNTASGQTSFVTGNNNIGSGENSFITGVNSIASGTLSSCLGSNLFSRSYTEVAMGIFNTDYTPLSTTTFNAADRIFSIGYGGGTLSRKDAIEVFKNGKIKINNRYFLPLTDGTANQVIMTDGAGNLSWTDQKNSSNITISPIYAADITQLVDNPSFNNSAFTNVNGCRSAIIPSMFNILGNVQVKAVVRYTASTGTVTNCQLRIRANNSVDGSTNIITPTDGWTNTTTTTGGVLQSNWVNWSSNSLNPFQTVLQAYVPNLGDSVTIANVYLMVRTQ